MQLMFGKLIADIARFMLTADCLLKLINTLNNDSKYWSFDITLNISILKASITHFDSITTAYQKINDIRIIL